MDEDERPWIGRRVWVGTNGQKGYGTLWSLADSTAAPTVLIRLEGGVPGVLVIPVAQRGTRWDFIEER
jgi:hypothetical protein